VSVKTLKRKIRKQRRRERRKLFVRNLAGRVMWLELLVRALAGTPNVHDDNYSQVDALLREWPDNPSSATSTAFRSGLGPEIVELDL
jgi:hypothetical protein